MPIHILKLLARHEIARETTLFKLEKPQGFQFKPGQYAGITLINPTETDTQGITRRFSLLNTPDDDHLSFATRIQTSAFKRVLKDLPIGDKIKLAGPTGTFILHEDTNIPAVLLAGGIGIAPFYSMIRHLTYHQSKQQIYLFYGNQTIENAAFLAELAQLTKQNPNFTLIVSIDKPDPNWTGEQGFITIGMIKKYISDLDIPIYYVCGSKMMVTAVQEILIKMRIDKAKIKVEDFPGY
jgi:ferredoxin-NADP reductase